jgi:hypothetical protein
MRPDVDRTEGVREAMTIACISPITGNSSFEQTTSITMVSQVRVNKWQFGGESAFFFDGGSSLLCRC